MISLFWFYISNSKWLNIFPANISNYSNFSGSCNLILITWTKLLIDWLRGSYIAIRTVFGCFIHWVSWVNAYTYWWVTFGLNGRLEKWDSLSWLFGKCSPMNSSKVVILSTNLSYNAFFGWINLFPNSSIADGGIFLFLGIDSFNFY